MITREVNGLNLTVNIPSIEEILSPDFNYPKYIETEITKELEKKTRGEVKQSSERISNPSYDYLDKIKQISELLLEKVMLKYEEDIKQGNLKTDIYTPQMKEIAQKYVEAKKEIEQKKRIREYENERIDFWQLHFDDLGKVKLDKNIKIKLLKLRRYLFASEKNSAESLDKKLDTIPIGQFAQDFLKNRGRIK